MKKLKNEKELIKKAIAEGCSPRKELEQEDLEAFVKARMWRPEYLPFVYSGKEISL